MHTLPFSSRGPKATHNIKTNNIENFLTINTHTPILKHPFLGRQLLRKSLPKEKSLCLFKEGQQRGDQLDLPWEGVPQLGRSSLMSSKHTYEGDGIERTAFSNDFKTQAGS